MQREAFRRRIKHIYDMFTIAFTLTDQDIEKLSSIRGVKNVYDALVATFVALCDEDIEDNGILYLDELKETNPQKFKEILTLVAAHSRELLLKYKKD